MKTKTLMFLSSLVSGFAGVIALFMPDELLALIEIQTSGALPTLIQVMGALYLGLAFINWTAKDSRIGGVYNRPVSLGNFGHTMIGALVLGKAVLTSGMDRFLFPMFIIYAVFAVAFGWLVFVATGISSEVA